MAPVAPTITPASGSYPAPLTVSVTHPTPGAKIKYAVGKTRMRVYGGPLTLPAGEHDVRARAFVDGVRSPLATAAYTVSEIVPGRPRVAVPDTIPGADGGDQSAALQAFLDDVPDGTDIYVPRLFRFDAAGPVLRFRRDLGIFGPGGFTTPTDGYDVPPTPGHEHKWPRTRTRFELIGCDDIRLGGDLLLQGSNQTNLEEVGYVDVLEGQHGVDIIASRRVTLDGVRVRHVRGDWVYMGGGARADGSRAWSEDVTVRHGDFRYNGRQGFGITGVRNAVIEDTVTEYCRRTLIDFEANGPNGGAVNVTFRRNTFGVHHLTGLTIHRTGILEALVFDDNVFWKPSVLTAENEGAVVRGLYLRRNRGTQPLGNPTGAAWRLGGVAGLVVAGNVVRAQAGRKMYLLRLRDCTGVDVADDNRFYESKTGAERPIIDPSSWYVDVDGETHGVPVAPTDDPAEEV